MKGILNPPASVTRAFNRAARLRKDGTALIEFVIYYGGQRRYISTHRYIKPENWDPATKSVNGDMSTYDINSDLDFMENQIKEVLREYLRKNSNKFVSIDKLREVVTIHRRELHKLAEFIESIIETSENRKSTLEGYKTLARSLNTFKPGGINVEDVDYNFVVAYMSWLKKERGLKRNTISSLLSRLKMVLNEALKKDFIDKNPFDMIKIPAMENKHGFLTKEQVDALMALKLKGLEKTARDAFILACTVGLRFSDIKRLKNSDIVDGWIIINMLKTGKPVEIPAYQLFNGRFLKILEEYGGNIEGLTRKIGENGQLNQALKRVFEKAGIDPTGKSFHLSRHTFASHLLLEGYDENVIQKLCGHTKLVTTKIYAETTREVIQNNIDRLKKGRKK